MGQIQHTTCFVIKKKKMYWDTATFIYLHIVYGCSHAKTAEMSNCDREHMAHRAKNIYYCPFIQKKKRLKTSR